MEIQYANVRLPVAPSMAARCCVPFASIPRLGTFVRGTATSVDGAAVTLVDGRILPYDYLVLAPGVGYADPLFKGSPTDDAAARAAAATSAAATLSTASSVFIVGGGPVGVEVAGELATDAPKVKVTLVTSADRLLAPKQASLGATAASWLTASGVRIITNATVEETAAEAAGGRPKRGSRAAATTTTTTTVKLSTGETLAADIVYHCHASPPHTAWLPAGVLDGSGFIKVDPHLRVQGSVPAPGRWFALGDACDAPGVKLGYLTRQQADVVAANVVAAVAAADGGEAAAASPLPATWAANGGGPEVMLVTLGRGAGTGHIGAWVRLPSLAVWLIKARDLFVGKTRAGVGAPAA